MANDKSIILQKQIRDNSEDLRSEFLDLQNWEERMKKADSEMSKAAGDQVLPPVRRKKKACKESTNTRNKINDAKSKRIKSSDYSAWEKYDVKKACEDLENSDPSDDQGEEPLSKEELEKNHADATERKIAGNDFVKKEEWAKAVACYNQAIKIFPYDAVFFANRALCHLKMDNLHSAEADCTAAIQLDEFYVKAYHRRATARIALKQYEQATRDVKNILKLEPSNKEAKIMLARLNASIEKTKPLIISSARNEIKKPEVEEKNDEKSPNEIVDGKIKVEENITDENITENKELKKTPVKLPEWLPEVAEDVDIVDVIKKLPHQRSKKPLKTITIEEIEFGMKLKIAKNQSVEKSVKKISNDEEEKANGNCESEFMEKEIPEAPKTAVQFLLTWRKNTSLEFRYNYLKKIPAERIPIIFQDSMESNTFSEIIKILKSKFTTNNDPIFDYLKYLSQVKRFRTLTMFMNKYDKEDLRVIFDYVRIAEGQSEDSIKDLYEKYEI